jgi:FkbM family methyltransferase
MSMCTQAIRVGWNPAVYQAAAAFVQSQVARSRVGIHLAIKLKHQCDAILAARLGTSNSFATNGERWLIEQIAPQAKFFIDVGANVGDWSREFASRMPAVARGIAFEPAPAAVAELQARLADYHGIEIVECAISDRSGKTTFYAEANCGQTSSLIRSHSQIDAKPLSVQVSTLDTEIAKRKIDAVDFLKIDAEGFDFHVLRGAEQSLNNHQIDVIQFEYNSPWIRAGATLAGAYEFLQARGYDVFLLRGPGLFRMDPDYYGEYFRYSMFVAIRTNSSVHEITRCASAL